MSSSAHLFPSFAFSIFALLSVALSILRIDQHELCLLSASIYINH
ncbi:hypothetical protein D049_2516 [Vibrio parahaemolyticus VPTS-2010]|nr:hypothetical protein D049_2516 [Vibrio parahaemolyticus VPTS-2010]